MWTGRNDARENFQTFVRETCEEPSAGTTGEVIMMVVVSPMVLFLVEYLPREAMFGLGTLPWNDCCCRGGTIVRVIM